MEQTDRSQRGEGGVDRMKGGEGISQRIYKHNPQTQTTVWLGSEGGKGGFWVEVGKGWGRHL